MTTVITRPIAANRLAVGNEIVVGSALYTVTAIDQAGDITLATVLPAGATASTATTTFGFGALNPPDKVDRNAKVQVIL